MTESNPAPVQAAPNPRGQVKIARRAAVASLVGTAIEWYDYFIFGTASALVFGRLFFPNPDNPIMGTLSALAVFGVGFASRPLGGIIFGHLGDRIGRKRTLVITLMLMGIATFLIGLLPTYDQIGILAPILLVTLRLLQGFGVGGEWGGAALVAVEFAPPGKRGRYGSAPQVGNGIGLLMAAGIFTLVSTLPDEQLLAWGWRIPFLISIVLIAVGLFIRFRLTETPAFQAAQRKLESAPVPDRAPRLPLVEVFRRFRKPLLLAMGMRFGEAVFGYVFLTIGLTYVTNFTTIPRTDVLIASSISAVTVSICYVVFGSLSDRIGRRKVFMIGAIVSAAAAFPFFWALDADNIVLMYLFYAVAYAIGLGAVYSVEPSFFSELFGTHVRYTGVSIAAQIPSILIGFWPLVSAALFVATDGDPWPIALITVVAALIGLLCAYLAPETYRTELEGDQTQGAPKPSA